MVSVCNSKLESGALVLAAIPIWTTPASPLYPGHLESWADPQVLDLSSIQLQC